MAFETYKESLPINKKGDIDRKLMLIDDKFMQTAASEFIDQMFGHESKLDKGVFILKLQHPSFKWLIDSQACRDKTEEWLKSK